MKTWKSNQIINTISLLKEKDIKKDANVYIRLFTGNGKSKVIPINSIESNGKVLTIGCLNWEAESDKDFFIPDVWISRVGK